MVIWYFAYKFNFTFSIKLITIDKSKTSFQKMRLKKYILISHVINVKVVMMTFKLLLVRINVSCFSFFGHNPQLDENI